MARRLRPLLLAAELLLLVAGLASTANSAKAQALPACAELVLRSKAQTSPKKLTNGAKVSVGLKVKNVGATALSGINIGVTSPVLAGWKAKGGQIEGGSVYWLSQTLKSKQEHRYMYEAQICAGVAVGSPAVVSVAVYRLDATGNVVCLSGATPINVSQWDWERGEVQEETT